MKVHLPSALRRNTRLVHMQCEGISQAASLTQSDANINCLNWTVGHIVVSRFDMIEAMGGTRPELDMTAYERESEPITGPGPGVHDIADLLSALDDTQATLESLIADMDDGGWAAPLEENPDRTQSDRVAFYYFHDTYHTGQTDLLRQVSGADDSLI